MLDEPQTVHAALVILGLLCVAVLFVAAKSPWDLPGTVLPAPPWIGSYPSGPVVAAVNK